MGGKHVNTGEKEECSLVLHAQDSFEERGTTIVLQLQGGNSGFSNSVNYGEIIILLCFFLLHWRKNTLQYLTSERVGRGIILCSIQH